MVFHILKTSYHAIYDSKNLSSTWTAALYQSVGHHIKIQCCRLGRGQVQSHFRIPMAIQLNIVKSHQKELFFYKKIMETPCMCTVVE